MTPVPFQPDRAVDVPLNPDSTYTLRLTLAGGAVTLARGIGSGADWRQDMSGRFTFPNGVMHQVIAALEELAR